MNTPVIDGMNISVGFFLGSVGTRGPFPAAFVASVLQHSSEAPTPTSKYLKYLDIFIWTIVFGISALSDDAMPGFDLFISYLVEVEFCRNMHWEILFTIKVEVFWAGHKYFEEIYLLTFNFT